jgi:flagellar L-ring protein FlgH
MKRFVLLCCALAAAWPATPAAGQDAAPAPAVGAAEAPAQTRTPRRSWTSDRRDYAVGDLVTVIVDERMMASATTGNTASDRRRRDMGASAAGSGAAAPLPPAGVQAGTYNDAESRQRGEAVRHSRFATEISVRVEAIEPNGLLRVKGSKLVNLDRNRQEVTLTGFVRPQDVGADNLVESWRIGDAQLVYTGRGSLGRPRGGIISRILGALWP